MHETGDELTAPAAPVPPANPSLVPRLTAGQVSLLGHHREVRTTAARQVLFREGDLPSMR